MYITRHCKEQHSFERRVSATLQTEIVNSRGFCRGSVTLQINEVDTFTGAVNVDNQLLT